MRCLFTVAVLSSAVAITACAPINSPKSTPLAQQSDARTCFRTMNVRSFSPDSDQTLYVRTAHNEVVQVDTLGECHGLDTAIAVDLRPQDGFQRLCTGDFSTLRVLQPQRETCRVQVVKQLSETEIAALPSRVRPKG